MKPIHYNFSIIVCEYQLHLYEIVSDVFIKLKYWIFLFTSETSKRLLEYLRRIFDQSMTNHQRYQISINKGEQYNDKKEILKNLLRSQLSLVETDSNPYYSKENFQVY